MSTHTKEHDMTISALKLISAKRSYTQQPIQQRRSKLSKRIWEQIELAKARTENKDFAPTRFKSYKSSDGTINTVEQRKRVKQWWWEQANGKITLSIRYGSKVIALNAKSNAVEVNTMTDLINALNVIKVAVDAGELDTQIETASTMLRKGFAK
jgi:L-rhamnose isomerase